MSDYRTRADEFVEPRDLEHLERQQGEQLQHDIYCTVTTYRKPDRLSVGDPAPDLSLTALDSGRSVPLRSTDGRPVLLVFGSYT